MQHGITMMPPLQKPSWWVTRHIFWGPVLTNTVLQLSVQTWQITTCHFVVHPMCFQGPWRPIPPMCLWKGLTSTTLSPMCPPRTSLILLIWLQMEQFFCPNYALIVLWENGFLSLCATSLVWLLPTRYIDDN